MWYSYQNSPELIPLSVNSVKKIIQDNKRNILPDDIESFAEKNKDNKSDAQR